MRARLGQLEADLARIKRKAVGWGQEQYEKETSDWAGKLSEAWERTISHEIVGRVVDRTTMEVRPRMFRLLACITVDDDKEFQNSYRRASHWARRHDKSPELNYVAPDADEMRAELDLVRAWFDRVRSYAS